ncbi:MAG: hypothetical protein ABII01_03395 [Candidatus Woesearchaeota archaeon]
MAEIDQQLKKELENFKQFVMIATVEAKKYEKTNLSIIKHFIDEDAIPGVYVTLNKPYDTLVQIFKKEDIDPEMIIFIDAVSKTAGGQLKKTDKCLFIGAPDNLSDISIAMDQAVRALPGKDRFVFFDSLSTLLLYNDIAVVARFIHFLSTKMRVWKVKGIIISLKKEKDKELIDELIQFCDVVLDL